MVQYQRGEHAILESYKNMRTSLIVNKDIKTILVTSSDMDEGKTTVISSLAKCFSELEDKKTLLIDCDLRNPSIHRHFELDNEKGLIDVIEEGSFKEYIKKVDDLHILTTGRKTKKPAELLESDYMKNFIEEAKEYYDYIFIDSPPVSRVNDACILANYIDGTVIVSASNEVDIDLAKLTKKRLSKVNANFIGVILNKFKDEDTNIS
ncbi:MAG: CpsD/CapB family tyrosine-protein kinase [Romboutsia timonensis]